MDPRYRVTGLPAMSRATPSFILLSKHSTARTATKRRPPSLGLRLGGLALAGLVMLGACDGMSGLSDLEFGQAVGSPCLTDTDCDRDTFCAPAIYRCEYQKDQGTECNADNECKGDFCSDGVCCNSVCDG